MLGSTARITMLIIAGALALFLVAGALRLLVGPLREREFTGRKNLVRQRWSGIFLLVAAAGMASWFWSFFSAELITPQSAAGMALVLVGSAGFTVLVSLS